MPSDDEKSKKAKRLHRDKVQIAKQMKIAKAAGLTVKHPGKLAKHHATNCGKAKCNLCGNPRRIRGEKTIQEKRSEQK